MRIQSNRKITTGDGTSVQLKKHPALSFKKNQRYITIKAHYKDIPCFITAHKRTGKNGSHQIVYIISNMDLAPIQQVKSYSIRWGIEKMFRTLKQSFGISQCQSTSHLKQTNHIFSCFILFFIFDQLKIYKRKKSPEEIIRPYRLQKTNFELVQSTLLETSYMI